MSQQQEQVKSPNSPRPQHHRWVKHTVTSVSAIPDIDEPDKVSVFEDPIDVRDAEDKAVYGCDVCGCPMQGNTDSLCPGPSVVDQFGVGRDY